MSRTWEDLQGLGPSPDDGIRRRQSPIRVGIVIPCYRVRRYVEGVVRSAVAFGDRVYVVDDGCPEGSGRFVESLGLSRVVVVYHERNCGVGGATITGIRRALEDGMDVIVKVDGDGQMDPRWIPSLVAPILCGQADYTKGNRFFYPEDLREMPWVRLLGNAALSFLSKFSRW
jgi:dolichol-phosphate mannosyltransferase